VEILKFATEYKKYERSTATNLAELRELFGPPPVLSAENEKAYDDLTIQLLQIFRPRDFIEPMYIRELADSSWQLARYTRHKTSAIDRKFHPRLEFQAKRDRARAQLKEAKARELAERNGEPAIQLDP
jgi:hypothetical protein